MSATAPTPRAASTPPASEVRTDLRPTPGEQVAPARRRDLAPVVVSVVPGSPAAHSGVVAGDEIVAVDGVEPRDIIEWQMMTDEADIVLDVRRGGLDLCLDVDKRAGESLGIEVSSAVFDRVRTCDNHCEFCFIYQLPKGMRRSLYLKDDDYRLSFLYGNFTTLTRFTELDLERIVTERLSPLHVSIHATDPALRSTMLKNDRGAMSLRWLRALLDHGIAVRGQIVVCPGVNDGAALTDTFAGILDRFPDLESVAVVPLGVSKFNPESTMRPHTTAEARAVIDAITDWQQVFTAVLGHPMVHAADEYYLLADVPFPDAEHYAGFPMHEDGIGMAAAFASEFAAAASGDPDVHVIGVRRGFFAAVDTPTIGVAANAAAEDTHAASDRTAGRANVQLPPNPAAYTGLRARSTIGAPADETSDDLSRADETSDDLSRADGTSGDPSRDGESSDDPSRQDETSRAAPLLDGGASDSVSSVSVGFRPSRRAPVGILTGELGARVLEPLVAELGRTDVRVLPVRNEFFGGNTGVTGLITASDVARVLAAEPVGHRYLLPDVCLSDDGRFLDGGAVGDLPRPVEIVPTDGASLRRALTERNDT